jgi:hypothetical protein
MNPNVWSKVAVAVQTALASAKTITAISKASPAVASSTAHGYVATDVVLLKINGMRQLNYRVARVLAAPTVDSFSLEGVDSTLYDTFVSGTAEKLTFGVTASTLKDVSGSGGEAEPILVRTIHEDQDFEILGNRSPLAYSFGSLWDPADPALLALAAFDETKTPGCVQLTFATGAKVFFAAYIGCNLVPVGNGGATVDTPPVTFRFRGRITNYAS